MSLVPSPFEFTYGGTSLIFGRGCIDRLGRELEARGLSRALVVCGSNVGANRALMDPLEQSLGDRHAATFDGTTPEKLVETVYEGIDAVHETRADVIIGVGGGSSLNIARQMSAFEDDGRSLSDFQDELTADGHVVPPAPEDPLPVVVVPTTLVGADLSKRGSVVIASASASPTGQPIRTSGTITSFVNLYDPEVFATTPNGAIARSAMNGFNKGIENLYAANATPITDATSMHGLGLFADGLRNLGQLEGLEHAIAGVILTQFGSRTSIIHAFGHGFSHRYDLQQGVAHAVVAPDVLRYVFEHVDGRRNRIAQGLKIETDTLSADEVAHAVVSEVTDIRDGLGLPGRLRDLDVVERDDLPTIAKYIADDPPLARAPVGLNATPDALESVLKRMW
jgi:alcohol dehydrogenase class IV